MRSFPEWSTIRPTRSKSLSLAGITSEPSVATPKTTQSNTSTTATSPSTGGVTMMRVPLPSNHKTIIGGPHHTTPPPQQRDMRRRRSQFFRGKAAPSPPIVQQSPGRCVVDTDAVASPTATGRLRRKGSLVRMAPFWRMSRNSKGAKEANNEKDDTQSVDSNDLMQAPACGEEPVTVAPPAIEIKVMSYEEEDDTREGCEDSILVTSHTSLSSSNQGLDHSDLRFSSDLGEVEVYIGDLIENDEPPAAVEQAPEVSLVADPPEPPPPVGLYSPPKRSPTPDSPRRVSSLQPSMHDFPMVEQSLAKQAAAEQMMAAPSRRPVSLSAPVAMIEREMSDLVSELTLPRIPRTKPKRRKKSTNKKDTQQVDDEEEDDDGEHLRRESVVQVQQAISQLHKEGNSLSSQKIISTLLQVTDSLACKRDRELIRQQLSQLSSFSDNEEEDEEDISVHRDLAVREAPPPIEEETITVEEEEESYMPGNMCQFPVGHHSVVGIDDDGSETSSFMDWLENQDTRKSQWSVFSEMVDLTNYWNTSSKIEQRSEYTEEVLPEEVEEDDDDDEQTVEVPVVASKDIEVKTPPKISRASSSKSIFRPRSFAQLQHEQHQKTAQEIQQEEDAIVAAGKRLLEHRARQRTSSSSVSPVRNKPVLEEEEDDVGTTAREMLFIRKHTGPVSTTLRSVPSDEMSHERYRAYIKERDQTRSKNRQVTKNGGRESSVSSNLRRISTVPVKEGNKRRSASPVVMVASPSYSDELRRRTQQRMMSQRRSVDP